MIEAITEKSANLLKVSFTGQVRTEDSKRGAERIELLLTELQPGFRLLTDLRSLEAMDLGCVPYIERVMDSCDHKGVGMVIRVIPDPHKDIGLNIMSLFHYSRRVRIVTCETIKEAERVLAASTA
jgi:hypothetical protein